jgi:hypothetical protein
MLEFLLTGIPLIGIWISIVQMSIGMWQYYTIQYAANAAGAYTAVHGANCLQGSNHCIVHISDIAAVLARSSFAIPRNKVTVTFTAWKKASEAIANTSPATVTCRLDNCISQSAYQTMQWPPYDYNYMNNGEVTIRATYVWKSALALLLLGPGSGPQSFHSYTMAGYTHQVMLF